MESQVNYVKYKKFFGVNYKLKLIFVWMDSIIGKMDSFSYEIVISVNDKILFMLNEKSEGE